MTDSIQDFSKQVRDSIEVLRASLSDLGQGEEGAESSLRRVARSIVRTAADFGLADVQQRGRAVEEAGGRPELIEGVQALIGSLDQLQEESGPTRVGILIVDDDPVSALLLESILEAPGREIVTAKTAAEAEEFLAGQAFDLLVLDLMLPDADGRDFLLKLRGNPAYAGVRVIISSGLRANRAKAECLALGADDYLEKPVEFELTRSVVARQLRGAPERRGTSLTDPDTGVANRAALFQAFEAEGTEDPESVPPLALASLSLHGLSHAVKTRGRQGRDKLLREFSRHISDFLGASDLLTADPDGQVLILFPGRSPGEAGELLERAQEALAGMEVEEVDPGDGPEFPRSFSAAVVDVSGEKDLSEGIARADRLLAQVRRHGPPRILAKGLDFEVPAQRVLLVEDDRVTATLIKHRLERDGFEVVHYDDGMAAFQAVSGEGGFALALFDVKLPGMDGFELLQRVRDLPHLLDLPVIMLTSMGREADVVRGLELGANDYVLKPFSSVELVARIRRSLGK